MRLRRRYEIRREYRYIYRDMIHRDGASGGVLYHCVLQVRRVLYSGVFRDQM